jgi:hypothetical protein
VLISSCGVIEPMIWSGLHTTRRTSSLAEILAERMLQCKVRNPEKMNDFSERWSD